MRGLFLALFTIIFVFLTSSCGHRTESVTVNSFREVKVTQKFEGIYRFSNGGYIELLQDNENQVTLLSDGQELVTVNPNETIGEFPKLARNNILIIQDRVFISADLTYNYSNGILDDNGNWVTGQRKTDIVFQKMGDKLGIHIQVFANKTGNSINGVVLDRTLLSE